jgi:hypothetical protein
VEEVDVMIREMIVLGSNLGKVNEPVGRDGSEGKVRFCFLDCLGAEFEGRAGRVVLGLIPTADSDSDRKNRSRNN